MSRSAPGRSTASCHLRGAGVRRRCGQQPSERFVDATLRCRRHAPDTVTWPSAPCLSALRAPLPTFQFLARSVQPPPPRAAASLVPAEGKTSPAGDGHATSGQGEKEASFECLRARKPSGSLNCDRKSASVGLGLTRAATAGLYSAPICVKTSRHTSSTSRSAPQGARAQSNSPHGTKHGACRGWPVEVT